MTSLIKPLPDKWQINDLLLPAKKFKYLEHREQFPFQFKPEGDPNKPVGHSSKNAWWMAECSMLAYDDKAVVENKLKSIETFAKKSQLHWEWIDQGSTQGFIIEADDFFLLVVRGTEFYSFRDITKNPMKMLGVVKDLIADAKLTLKPIKGASNKEFHVVEGFYKEFSSIQPQVDKFINSSNKPIWLTGHSLGAAIVTYAAYHYGNERVAGLYTFGSPCVGDKYFADEFDQVGLNQLSFRYSNGNDLVAKGLPFWRDRFGVPKYQHVGILKTLASKRNFFSRFIPLDMTDHAPIFYVLKCWNLLVTG